MRRRLHSAPKSKETPHLSPKMLISRLPLFGNFFPIFPLVSSTLVFSQTAFSFLSLVCLLDTDPPCCLAVSLSWIKVLGLGGVEPSDNKAFESVERVECSWKPVMRRMGVQQRRATFCVPSLSTILRQPPSHSGSEPPSPSQPPSPSTAPCTPRRKRRATSRRAKLPLPIPPQCGTTTTHTTVRDTTRSKSWRPKTWVGSGLFSHQGSFWRVWHPKARRLTRWKLPRCCRTRWSWGWSWCLTRRSDRCLAGSSRMGFPQFCET